MADFDVSLRLGIDYQDGDAKKAERDLQAIQRAARQLGAGNRLDDGLKATGRSADAAERKVRDLSREAQRLGTTPGADRLGRDILQLGTSARRSEQEIEELRRAAERLGAEGGAKALAADLGRAGGEARQAEDRIDQVRDSVRRLGRENGVADLGRDFDRAETSARRVEERLGRIRQSGRRLSGGGSGRGRDFAEETLERSGLGTLAPVVRGGAIAAGMAAAAPVYGVTKATGEAMQLETAMAEVKRQVDGVDDTGIQRLRNGILRLSEDTGIAKENLAALVANAAKTKTAYEDLLPFASYAAKFAVAADMEQGEAGGTLSLIRSQFKVPQARIPQILDSVNYLADRSATSERAILEFMQMASQNVDVANFSPEQLAAFGTGYLNVGAAPAVSGTGFNALIGRLGTASDRSRSDKNFRRSLGRLGLNGRDLQSDFFQDSAGTVLALLDRVNALPRDQRLSVLRGLGGEEYADDIARLSGQTDALRGFLADSTSPAAKGSVDATFAVANDTTARDLAKASAALASLGAEIGETFLPAVRIFARAVATFAGGWAESIRQERLKDAIVGKMVAGETLTDKESEDYGADQELKDRIDAEVDRRRRAIERQRRQVEDYELRTMDDPDAQARAAGRALAERNRADTIRQIGESRRVLDVLSPEQPGYRDTQRKLEALEKRLEQIDKTLKDGFGGLKASPIGFFGGTSGEPRLWNASLGPRGGGMFRRGYGGSRPVMDGMAGLPASGSGGRQGPSIGDAARLGGRPGGDVHATTNPGGTAGDIYDILSTGFSDAQSFALLGHMQQESGLDPNAWNPRERAGGLLQWRGNRLANLKAFAADKGMDWRDHKVQAAFVAHEMRTDPYERKRSARFRSATTIADASAALKDYVRFGDKSGGRRLANAERFAGAFGAQPAGAAVGARAPVRYANAGATRNRPVDPELLDEIQKGIAAVYGEGYRAEIYSGGQAAKGSGGRRVGSTRHDDHGAGGLAADLYVYGPDGEKVTGAELARLGQHWAATKQGGVGLEMRGGGIHLDRHKNRPPHWNYAREGGRYTREQAAIMRRGLAGEAPAYVNPGALSDKAVADGAEPVTGPRGAAGLFGEDGWTRDASRRPQRAPASTPRPGAGAGPGRVPSGPGAPAITNNFHGVDPQIMAARAARAQRREIRAAEARAMHDTAVPVA